MVNRRSAGVDNRVLCVISPFFNGTGSSRAFREEFNGECEAIGPQLVQNRQLSALFEQADAIPESKEVSERAWIVLEVLIAKDPCALHLERKICSPRGRRTRPPLRLRQCAHLHRHLTHYLWHSRRADLQKLLVHNHVVFGITKPTILHKQSRHM